MKNTILSLAILLTVCSVSNAQFELGLVSSPSISTISSTNEKFKDQDFSNSYTYPLNFGLRANYKFDRFILSTGILHLTQGRKYEIEKTSPIQPEGTGDYYDVFIRARKLVIPINLDFMFLKTSKSIFFGGFGLYIGHIYSQELENTVFPKDWKSNPDITYREPVGRYHSVRMFEDFYAGFNFGLGWRYEITDSLYFQLRPNLLYMLENPAPYSLDDNRLLSFNLDIGVFYRLGDEFE